MIQFKQAYKIIMDSARLLGTERVNLSLALRRVLAEDVSSDIDMPSFNKSARDGYACRREDINNELEVIEVIPAGYVPRKIIGKNQCAKIMTGAIVPEGADCIVMVEFTQKLTDNTIKVVNGDSDDYIYFAGEDVRAGDVVIKRGTVIHPQHIAILAAVGCTNPLVYMRPRVGIITTGNEIVEPDVKPTLSQIRNSNGHQLAAQLTDINALSKYYGIAKDDEFALNSMFRKAIAESDVVIVSGGVSMGDFDIVPYVAQKNGIKILFHKVAIKPGKPLIFGTSEKIAFFGLPGNPVSTFVSFELFVKPFLLGMMGHKYEPHTITLPLAKTVRRRKAERLEWFPVQIVPGGQAMPVEYHGSGHITALSETDGIFPISIGTEKIEKGTMVNVRWIRS